VVLDTGFYRKKGETDENEERSLGTEEHMNF
jgi:hypothetical protein